MTVGYLAHPFDLLNVRHLDLLAQAGARCTRLVVGVFTDDHAADLYGRRPVVPLGERMALLAHVRGVAEVVRHDDQTLLAAGMTRFAVVGDPCWAGHTEELVALTPRRDTASTALRAALGSVRRDAVA